MLQKTCAKMSFQKTIQTALCNGQIRISDEEREKGSDSVRMRSSEIEAAEGKASKWRFKKCWIGKEVHLMKEHVLI